MTIKSENRLMPGVAVALLTEDRDQSHILTTRLEATNLARVVFSHSAFPAGPGDSILRHLHDQHAEVVLVEIDAKHPQGAIRTIELIHNAAPDITIFALGDMTQPLNIVSAMRAG